MPIASKRQLQLYAELRDALRRVSARDLKTWGRRAAARVPAIGARKVRNLGSQSCEAAELRSSELSPLLAASRHTVLMDHLASRSADAVDLSIGIYNGAASMFDEVRQSLLREPRRMADAAFALALGLRTAPGTLPSATGISLAHDAGCEIRQRPGFSHSIVAETVTEAAILGVADLADVVREHVPVRDCFWDRLAASKGELASALAAGTRAGTSYRLTVEATLEAAPAALAPMHAASLARPLSAALSSERVEDVPASANDAPHGAARGSADARWSVWRARRVAPGATPRRARRRSS